MWISIKNFEKKNFRAELQNLAKIVEKVSSLEVSDCLHKFNFKCFMIRKLIKCRVIGRKLHLHLYDFKISSNRIRLHQARLLFIRCQKSTKLQPEDKNNMKGSMLYLKIVCLSRRLCKILLKIVISFCMNKFNNY